jgi:hypothetical protein
LAGVMRDVRCRSIRGTPRRARTATWSAWLS